jgi:two-component system response regulator MprA
MSALPTDLDGSESPYGVKLRLDVAHRALHCGGIEHHLTPKECRLLEIFLEHPGQVLTRQFLMKEVWLTDYVADTRTLEVHVHWLRQKLEAGDGPRLIHTVRSVGYILRPVEEAAD